MTRKLDGTFIQSGTITVNQLAGGLNDTSNASYAQANAAYSQANAFANQPITFNYRYWRSNANLRTQEDTNFEGDIDGVG